MRSMKTVTLKGEWRRTNTTLDDIRFMRNWMLERRLRSVNVTFKFRTDSVDGSQWPGQTRTGTFVATIGDVPHLSEGDHFDREVIQRAFGLLKSYLREATCRAPGLVLDRKRCKVEQAWIEEG